jgi:hypothetical protein
VPLFAFWVILFFGFKHYCFVETLIISLYFHAFGFLIFAVSVLLKWTVSPFPEQLGEVLSLIFLLAFLIYFFLVMKTLFGKSFFFTWWRVFLICIFHLISVIVLLIGTLLLRLVWTD